MNWRTHSKRTDLHTLSVKVTVNGRTKETDTSIQCESLGCTLEQQNELEEKQEI